MTTTTLLAPAEAIAVARCVAARSVPWPVGPRPAMHPTRCAWCEYPVAALLSMLDAFNAWAGWDERSRTFERHEARVFAELPRPEQDRLATEAQGLEPEHPVVAAPVVVQEPEPEEDLSAWEA